jgi:type III pantothenate kinase
MSHPRSWLALMIGNSRLHWAWFLNGTLRQTWDIPHLPPPSIASLFTQGSRRQPIPDAARDLLMPLTLQPESPLWIASVVPSQTTLWQVYPHARVLRLEQIPLQGLYPSLGIDRALAVLGASRSLGFPVLVIDAGTALTFTAADEQTHLLGGAIVAGLQTQWRAASQIPKGSLAQNTAALPVGDAASATLPERWAMNTPDAIRSGIIYTLLASIRDYSEAWLERFPEGAIALTGGDGAMLFQHLQTQFPALATHITVDPNLIFWGMQEVCAGQQ